jgi:hypothetical protein
MHDRLIRCLGPHAPYLGFLEDHYHNAESRENRIIRIVTKNVLSQLQGIVESEVSKQLAKMRNGVGAEASTIPAMPLFSCSPQQFTSIHDLPTIAADDADNPWQDAAGQEVPAVRKAASSQAGMEAASVVDGESATATVEQGPVINRHLAPPSAKLSQAPEQPPPTFQAFPREYIHRVLGVLSIPTPIRIYKDGEPSRLGTLLGTICTIVHHATVRPVIVLVDTVAKNPQLVLICALFMFLISALTTVGILKYMFCELRHPSRNLPYTVCLGDYHWYWYEHFI